MTVLGYYQVIPLSFKRSGRFIVLLILGLSVSLPNAFTANNGGPEIFDPIKSYYDTYRLHLDAISTLNKLLLSSPESATTPATVDITCPGHLIATCGSPEAALPTNLAEFEAAGGSVSSTCNVNRIIYKIFETSLGGCPEVVTRTVWVTDFCGDAASCSYTVTLEGDTEPPVVKCPEDITVNCPEDIPDADVTTVNVEDMCGTAQVKHLGDDTSELGLCPGFIYRSYIAEDQCGNAATCIQTITVNNNCDPDDPCTGICDPDVPVFTVDLASSPDSTWKSPEVMSNGSCCVQSGNPADMCVHFLLTLASDAVAIKVELLSGAPSSDSIMFQIGCSESYPIGEVVCLTGGQSLDLTFCHPDDKPFIFQITSYSTSSLPDANQDGIPDVCTMACDNVKLAIEGCAVVFIGYGPAECTDLVVYAEGGVPPFNYSWSTNDTTPDITVCPISDETYTVTVSDSTGCTIEASVTVYAIKVSCGSTGRSVRICHLTNSSSFYQNICVDESEVAAHLAHGDALGACGTNPCFDYSDPISQADTLTHVVTGDPDRVKPRPFVQHDGNSGDYIYPNPVADVMTIQFEMPFSQTVVLNIFDAQGKHIDAGTSLAAAGINSFQFNTSNLQAGLYFVRYGNGHEIRSLKFVKLE